MTNLKIGGVLLIAGAALFVLSDSLFGDTEVASYSAFFGLIMVPVGLILVLAGVVQMLTARIKGLRK
jgi:predicted phage tail protein